MKITLALTFLTLNLYAGPYECLQELNNKNLLQCDSQEEGNNLGTQLKDGNFVLYNQTEQTDKLHDVLVTKNNETFRIPYGPECLSQNECIQVGNDIQVQFKIDGNVVAYNRVPSKVIEVQSATQSKELLANVTPVKTDGRFPASSTLNLKDNFNLDWKNVATELKAQLTSPERSLSDCPELKIEELKSCQGLL